VGADGPTHNGSFDESFLRCMPGMVLMAPADENECRQMLYTGFQIDGPAAVRYPRGGGSGVAVEKQMTALPIGKAEVRRRGQGIALLAFGSLVSAAEAIGQQLDATVVNMRFIKPVDEAMVLEMAATHSLLVTLDENAIAGGAGGAVSEVLATHAVAAQVLHLGLPDRFLEHGSRDDMLREAGLGTDQLLAAITARWALLQGAASGQASVAR